MISSQADIAFGLRVRIASDRHGWKARKGHLTEADGGDRGGSRRNVSSAQEDSKA